MAFYPRRRITITACVLLCLGYALLKLPFDQKAYAKESGDRWQGMLRSGEEVKSKMQKPARGGMVKLKDIKAVSANHEGSKATKQVLIVNGQVPHVTSFARTVFGEGYEVEEHVHLSMDEVFYVEEGEGIFEIDGTVVQVGPGTCVHVAAGQKHRVKQTGKEDLVMLYFAIATEET